MAHYHLFLLSVLLCLGSFCIRLSDARHVRAVQVLDAASSALSSSSAASHRFLSTSNATTTKDYVGSCIDVTIPSGATGSFNGGVRVQATFEKQGEKGVLQGEYVSRTD